MSVLNCLPSSAVVQVPSASELGYSVTQGTLLSERAPICAHVGLRRLASTIPRPQSSPGASLLAGLLRMCCCVCACRCRVCACRCRVREADAFHFVRVHYSFLSAALDARSAMSRNLGSSRCVPAVSNQCPCANVQQHRMRTMRTPTVPNELVCSRHTSSDRASDWPTLRTMLRSLLSAHPSAVHWTARSTLGVGRECHFGVCRAERLLCFAPSQGVEVHTRLQLRHNTVRLAHLQRSTRSTVVRCCVLCRSDGIASYYGGRHTARRRYMVSTRC
jgi:hypothetical protein